MTKTKHRPPPQSREELRPVDKAFIHTVMFELGILPIEDPVLDMRVPLRQLTLEDARVFKRKFRKLWRKLARNLVVRAEAEGENDTKKQWAVWAVKKKYGMGKQQPSRAEKLARKRLVYEQIWERVIVPMLQKFENPERGPKEEPSKGKT